MGKEFSECLIIYLCLSWLFPNSFYVMVFRMWLLAFGVNLTHRISWAIRHVLVA